MNDAYDVRMKEYRLRKLQALPDSLSISWIFPIKSIVEHFKGDNVRCRHQPGSAGRGALER
jgi:hypothetical protein